MKNAILRQSLVFAMTACISAGAWADNEGVKLDSEIDMTSYALGYQIGGDFRRQHMKLNEAAVGRGIADARSGGIALMTDQSMRAALTELKRKVVAQEAQLQIDDSAEIKGLASPDIAAVNTTSAPAHARRAAARMTASSSEFLDKNAQQKGMVTLPSGLQYRVIKEGDGKQPQADDKVSLIYRGAFVNGNEFGNTDQEGKPAPKTFPLAALVPGMREAISRMKEGGEWQVFVPPELGFDSSTPLYRKITVFDVKLVAVNP